jgi:hypothetical protein
MSQVSVSCIDIRTNEVGCSYCLPANFWDASRILGVDEAILIQECKTVCVNAGFKLSGWKRNGDFLKVSNSHDTCLLPLFVR